MIGFHDPARLFWLVGVAAWAAALVWRARRDRVLLRRIGEERLLRTLMDPVTGRRRWQEVCGVAALALLVLAMARPQWGTKLTEIRRRGNDVLIAVDLSTSMLAEDVPPNRIAKAKRSLGLLVSSLHGDRVGIIAFSGDAFLQCPLTLDVEAAGMFLNSLDVGMVPVPGTALGTAVRRALKSFPKGSTTKKILVLLTDGEDTRGSDPIGAAKEAKAAGVIVNTIGVGTPQGDVIKLRDGSGAVTSFKKDEKGETVLSRMAEATLMEMARMTGGVYFRGQPDDSEIAPLVASVSSYAQQTLSTQTHRVREDRYQGFLLVAILLLIADRLIARRGADWREIAAGLRTLRWDPTWPRLPSRWRRGGSVMLLCVVGCLGATAALADWKADLRLGNRWMSEGNAEEARQKYLDAQTEAPEQPEPPYNIGNSYLYEGKFDEALKAYEQAGLLARAPLMKSILAYNRGWALARAEREPEAIAAFKEALRWNPRDEDARFNLEWLRSPRQPKKKKPGEGQPQQGKPKPGDLSKEDAERVLEMVRDQEKRMREDQKQQRKKDQKPGGEKDW